MEKAFPSNNIFRPFILSAIAMLAFMSISRAVLIFWQFDRVSAVGGISYVLLQGLRFDLILLAILFVIPLALTPFLTVFRITSRPWLKFLRIYLALGMAIIIFTELSTPSFIKQFDLMPNILYVEYLKYPKEVITTLWEAYRIELIIAVSVTMTGTYWLYRKLYMEHDDIKHLSWWQPFILTPLLLVMCVGVARSTLDHRAVNPSTVAFSSDPLVNGMSLSPAYSILYAVYEMRHENNGGIQYGDMDTDDIYTEVKHEMHVDEFDFISDEIPTLHMQQATIERERHLNIVIILEESLGAEFVGSLGGLPLTPNIDSLKDEGIWFDNLYATGTRSVRGIEALISGFSPTPARSVVKLSKSQTRFFTIAELLGDKGYDTSFIYGGESHFDNMRLFFANNGFKKVIDENDYENPEFVGTWGVSDEDLLNKAHETFEAYPKDQPFFSLVFTSSNHSPFEFPDDKIELYEPEKQTVNNAVKYADYAVGQFIKKAKQSSYWDNTLFLIVADHNSRVYGSELVPVNRFHIPGLILGGQVKPRLHKGIASQIDMMPTLLSLAGINSEHPAIGHDLTSDVFATLPGHAIMQYDASQAYMEGNRVIILQKGKQPQEFKYINNSLVKSDEQDEELFRKAIAHSLWPMMAYRERLYHMPCSNYLAADFAANDKLLKTY